MRVYTLSLVGQRRAAAPRHGGRRDRRPLLILSLILLSLWSVFILLGLRSFRLKLRILVLFSSSELGLRPATLK